MTDDESGKRNPRRQRLPGAGTRESGRSRWRDDRRGGSTRRSSADDRWCAIQ
jgi:hypothetical protein